MEREREKRGVARSHHHHCAILSGIEVAFFVFGCDSSHSAIYLHDPGKLIDLKRGKVGRSRKQNNNSKIPRERQS